MGEPCGFCKGRPVGDAASWLDGKRRPPLPCPRCGKTVQPADPVATAERIAAGGTFTNQDATAVAQAYLALVHKATADHIDQLMNLTAPKETA